MDKWRNHFLLPPGSDRGADLTTWAGLMRELSYAVAIIGGAAVVLLLLWLAFV